MSQATPRIPTTGPTLTNPIYRIHALIGYRFQHQGLRDLYIPSLTLDPLVSFVTPPCCLPDGVTAGAERLQVLIRLNSPEAVRKVTQ